MMDGMSGMGLLMLVALIVIAVVIGVAIYLAIRAGTGERRREPDAHELLRKRLASGEIAPEEYYERESALGPPAGARRGR